MISLIERVLKVVNSTEQVAVFTGEHEQVAVIVAALKKSLPEFYTAAIEVRHIDDSTAFLKASRDCEVFYTSSCFRVIGPEEFLATHYKWLEIQISRFYEKQPDISGFFSEDDAFQEAFTYLERILAKYNNQCNLRSYVWNRLRFYLQWTIDNQLKLRLGDLSSLH